MFQDLQWACVATFTASIPLLVLAHYRYPESPPRHFIVLAAVLGWVLANAHAGIQLMGRCRAPRRMDRL
jgi:hypothetical protein